MSSWEHVSCPIRMHPCFRTGDFRFPGYEKDERIASYTAMGRELATYTYMGGTNEIEKGLLMTFRKREAGSEEMQHGRDKDS